MPRSPPKRKTVFTVAAINTIAFSNSPVLWEEQLERDGSEII
jgi:hypothetical protein